jgi:hypothetical protein
MDLIKTSSRRESSLAGCDGMWRLLAVAAVMVLLVGCGRFAKSPGKPALSPEKSAEQAMQEYDSDGNGSISVEEAAASPGLTAAFEKIDKSADGELSAQEIVDRINYYKNATSWVINGQIRIIHKRRPLVGATVTFEPEPFLGPSFKVCSGVTDDRGEAFIKGDDALPGIYLGFYRVKVNKEVNGKEILPAKYNEETELGFEANNDVPEIPDMINFELK